LVLSVVLSGVKDLFFESLKSPPRSFVAALLRMTKPVFFPSGDAIYRCDQFGTTLSRSVVLNEVKDLFLESLKSPRDPSSLHSSG